MYRFIQIFVISILLCSSTQYLYAGRYYDSATGRWLSVDPKADKYPGWSPYNYCLNNPLKYLDPDGKGPFETWMFAFMHPIIATNVGQINSSNNISSISSRFADMTGLNGFPNQGSQVNAYRHTMWQETITETYGSEIAKKIGDAHEMDPNVNTGIRTFTGRDSYNDADQTCDLLNNEIGRKLGIDNPSATNKERALKVLDIYHNSGLYEIKMNPNGSISVVKTKLSDSDYNTAVNNINDLNENGRTSQQQIDYDQARFEANQKLFGAMK